MNGIKRIVLWIPLSLFIFLGFCNSLNETPDQKLLGTIMETLQQHHFNAIKIDDNFSKEVFQLYLNRLDGNKRFFLEKDMNKFKKHELKIDDQCKKRDLSFFNLVNETYSKRLLKIEKMIENHLSNPFDFTSNESIELDGDKLDAPKNLKEQSDRWRKALKVAVLEKIARQLDAQEKAKENKDTSFKFQTQDSIEYKARKEVLKTHKEWFKRLKRMKHRDRLTIYLNAISNRFDPHTGYFPPKDKENFDIGMSGRLEGIGATLSERDGYIKVEHIVPGSASYKQGELKKGDLILKVGQGDKTPVDVVDMPLDDAVQLIRGKKGSVVKLTVKKPDGSQVIIPITRDVVVIEEGYAKSAIIQTNGKKIGYLYLPQFYADFNRRGGRAAGEDVKRELIKLKREKVDGIIFDMRNNGGGSLDEAIKIGGHFVRRGPMVQVKETNRRADIYEDRDRGATQYDGPLVVLVNSFSASASEIVAAALQDHNRAIIMGTKSTYGKGTVQTFVNLDRLSIVGNKEAMGALKLTIQKFYRINGGSTQLKGVVPDIIFPDHYDSIEIGERDQQYPLDWDKIDEAMFFPISNDFSRIVKKSQLRIETSEKFDLIKEYTMHNKKRSDKTNYSLNLETYRDYQKKYRETSKKYSDVYKTNEPLSVSMLSMDREELSSDSTKLQIKEDWINSLKRDIY